MGSAQRLANRVLQIHECCGNFAREIDSKSETMALLQAFKFAQGQGAIELAKRIRSTRNGNVVGEIGGTDQVLTLRLASSLQLAVMMESMGTINQNYGNCQLFG